MAARTRSTRSSTGPERFQALCRSVNWSATQLGPVEGWPQSLRLAVRMCLDARIPMTIWAGPELVLIYNHGYPPVLGPARHPWALGRPAREVWAEIWDRLGPELDRVMRKGESTVHEDERFVLERGGPTAEECFFTYSFTPIQEADGRIVGALNVFLETTDRVRSLGQSIAEREAVRAQLERANQKLNDILESIEDDFYVLDRDWRFVFTSRRFTSRIGEKPEDFLGRRIWEVFPRHLGGAIEENFRAAMDRRETRRFEVADYAGAVYRMTAFPSADGITVLGTDITEQKRAAEELGASEERARAQAEELDAIIEAMGEGLNIVDAEGRMLRMNRAGARLLGYASPDEYARALPEFQDTWVLETLDGRRVSMQEWPLSRALSGESFTDYELIVRKRDGSLTRTLSHAGTPIRGERGEIVRAIVTYRDVTGLLEAQRSLSLANAQLVDADRRKNDFLAMLSHELRNPLAPIVNCLALLDQAPPGGDQARRAKAIIDRQVDQLTRLVDDLLDVTRITRGKIQLQRQRVDLDELVQRTLEDHRSLFDKAGIGLGLLPAPAPVWVRGDRNRLAQTVGNLLHNAAKFTPRDGRVTVSVSADERLNQALVRIVDTGVGLAPEMLARLFQPFMQAERTIHRAKGGLGLGLALVRELVELHGGSVEARSEGVGQGAELTVRLPLAPPAPAAKEEPGSASGRPRRRVLIIEDNVDAAESLREVLELEHHDVAVAHDGPSGLAKAHQLRPAVILCDIGLPDMDGYEVARAVRAEPELARVHLVALSGYAMPEDLERARRAGFDRHMAKPPSLVQLRSVLAEVSGDEGRGDSASGAVSD